LTFASFHAFHTSFTNTGNLHRIPDIMDKKTMLASAHMRIGKIRV
jgi:hypothetical protein